MMHVAIQEEEEVKHKDDVEVQFQQDQGRPTLQQAGRQKNHTRIQPVQEQQQIAAVNDRIKDDEEVNNENENEQQDAVVVEEHKGQRVNDTQGAQRMSDRNSNQSSSSHASVMAVRDGHNLQEENKQEQNVGVGAHRRND